MRWCLLLKLAQNWQEFGTLLRSTGALPLVEESARDDFWGAKPVESDSNILIGRNVLGRLLMDLREKLRASPGIRGICVRSLPIPNFRLGDRQICDMTICLDTEGRNADVSPLGNMASLDPESKEQILLFGETNQPKSD